MKKRTWLLASVLPCAAFAALEAKASRGSCSGSPDALLILGTRVRGETAEPALRMRAERAAAFLREHPSVTAVPCGGIVHDDQTKSEAQAIREILLQNGVADSRILLEDRSRTTFENFTNAKQLLAQAGLSSPRLAVLSSDFHLLRASLIGRLCGVRAETVAAPSPKNEKVKNYLREAAVFPLLPLEYLRKR